MEFIKDNLVLIIAAVVALGYIIYSILSNRPQSVKILENEKPLKIIGISILSTDKTIKEDDASLWKEFIKIRDKYGLPSSSTFVIRFNEKPDNDKYEYFIGVRGTREKVPSGFRYLEINADNYLFASTRHNYKKEVSWLESSTKLKFDIYYKWLPSSEYELNKETPIKAIEHHQINSITENRNTKIFVSVKKKKQA